MNETTEQRLERIFKEDEEIQLKRELTRESNELKENQLRRFNCLEIHKEFIDNMIIRKNGEKQLKNITYRKYLKINLYELSTRIFETQQEEYEYIGKYDRGLFRQCETTFNETDLITIHKIAEMIGAYDY